MSTVQRLTFREKQSGVAWQKLIRDKAAARYKGKEWWAGADLSLKKAVVRETTRAVAKKIIHEYEWLGTLPNCTRYYGIFFDGWACGGVACWSQGGGGANVFAHMELGVERAEMSYLVRGACTHWTPKGTASKLISITLREEAKKGSAVAIAYSDTDAGEIGTVYQATNWLCIGRGVRSQEVGTHLQPEGSPGHEAKGRQDGLDDFQRGDGAPSAQWVHVSEDKPQVQIRLHHGEG